MTRNTLSPCLFAASVIFIISALNTAHANEKIELLSNSKPNLVTLTVEEEAWLSSHQEIEVAVRRDWQPVEFTAERKEVGISIDYLNLVEEKLGIKFIKVSSTENPATESADIISAVNDLNTLKNTNYVAINMPYLKTPNAIFTANSRNDIHSIKDLINKKVVVYKNNKVGEKLENDYPQIQLFYAENVEEALGLIMSGKVDAYIGNQIVVNYLANAYGFKEIKMAGASPYNVTFNMAVKSNLPILQSIMTKSLLPLGTQKKLIEANWDNTKKNNDWYLITASAIFTFIMFVMIVSRKRLRRQFNQSEETSQKLIWQQTNFDPLTNLPNRSMFREHLHHAMKKSDDNTLPLALLFLDLDQFKHVNDNLGHALGDNLLAEVSQRITSCVRESDIVARLGGDEFTIILSNVKNLRYIERISLDVLRKIADPFYVDERALYLSASIGIAIYPNDGKEIDVLLKQADQAMYAAKNMGGNRYHFFTPDLQETAETKVRIINDLHSALIDDQFQLYYQPIIELSTNQVFKAEALIRWVHPINGIINPCQFIHIAEKTNMIAAIGDWVFRNAAQYTKQLHALNPNFQMSINVSPLQFVNNAKTTKWISYLSTLGIPARSITIEITEGLLLDLTEAVKQQLTQYREAGIKMAIDDFGTGYSSLAYLKKFDIDYIKIDRAFIKNLAVENSDRVLCEAIIDMAHKLGFKVIAEGVETEAQLALLKQAGCDFGQGFLFSKPVPELEFNQYLTNLLLQQA